MFGFFTLVIKSDCLFLGIFKFFLIYEFYFWQISPPPKYMFQNML